MTIKDIAALANVSVSTVSKALCDSYDIAPQTRELVLKIAVEKGYFSDKKATRMQNSSLREPTVAIICPEIISIHYSHIATVLTELLTARSAKSVLYLSGFEQNTVRHIFDSCLSDTQIAAVICLSAVPLCPPNGAAVPTLALGKSALQSSLCIRIDDSVAMALDHLRADGHTRIGFVSEPHTGEKLAAFRRLLHARHLSLREGDIFIGAARFEEAGRKAAQQFLAHGEDVPTAVICAYDELACGFLDTLQQNGIRAPQDISVIGINNIPLSAYCFGGLSTVDPIDDEVLSRAVDDLLEDIRHRGSPTLRRYSMTPRLHVRGTTAPLEKSKKAVDKPLPACYIEKKTNR